MSFNTIVTYTADGATNSFTVPFEYLLEDHVKMYLDGVEDETFTFLTSSSVAATSTPADGVEVTIKRITPTDALVTVIPNTGTFRSVDLNNQALQALYVAEEGYDALVNVLSLDTADDTWDADSKVIKNVATPTAASHAARKDYVDAVAGSATAADASATAASASATAASASATAASSSASAAATSASEAASSATDAANSESAVSASASAAAASAATAASEATDAATQATNAAGSASTASTHATTAESHKDAAASSASAASASETAAAASASAASTAETNAEAAESNAAASETGAENAQDYAEEWATKVEDSLISAAAGGNQSSDYSALHHAAKAAGSASAASTSASIAASSESAASSSASAAATSASNASTSETNADAAETAAQAAQSAAETAETNAETAETNAAASAAAAATSESNAAASAALAATFDPADYVAIAGDTMTGDLTVDGADIILSDATEPTMQFKRSTGRFDIRYKNDGTHKVGFTDSAGNWIYNFQYGGSDTHSYNFPGTGGASFGGDINLGLNQEINLDDDGDSSIDCNADDNMRFKTGASTRMQITNTEVGFFRNLDVNNYIIRDVGEMRINEGGILHFDPGSDIDQDVFQVNVTGTPKLYWDESNTSFRFGSSGLMVDFGLYAYGSAGINSYGGPVNVNRDGDAAAAYVNLISDAGQDNYVTFQNDTQWDWALQHKANGDFALWRGNGSGSFVDHCITVSQSNAKVTLTGDLQLGLNQKIYLDDDADSYIQATADDTIKISQANEARILTVGPQGGHFNTAWTLGTDLGWSGVASFEVNNAIAGRVGITARGHDSQTDDLLQLRQYDNTVVFEVDNDGNVTLSGTLDGRDVASDGSKLDSVESGADVTDVTNVTAAGALMDSELADLAGVKALVTTNLVYSSLSTTFTNSVMALGGHSASGQTANSSADHLIADGSGASGISILSGNTNTGNIYFGDTDSNNRGRIIYNHSDNSMSFYSNASEKMLIDSGGLQVTGNLDVSGWIGDSETGALTIPDGTTAQRPTAVRGMIRYNTSDDTFEGYNGTEWGAIGGGGPAVGNDSVIRYNPQNVTEDCTLPADSNGFSAGPIEIDNGVTVTLTSGSNWTII